MFSRVQIQMNELNHLMRESRKVSSLHTLQGKFQVNYRKKNSLRLRRLAKKWMGYNVNVFFLEASLL